MLYRKGRLGAATLLPVRVTSESLSLQAPSLPERACTKSVSISAGTIHVELRHAQVRIEGRSLAYTVVNNERVHILHLDFMDNRHPTRSVHGLALSEVLDAPKQLSPAYHARVLRRECNSWTLHNLHSMVLSRILATSRKSGSSLQLGHLFGVPSLQEVNEVILAFCGKGNRRHCCAAGVLWPVYRLLAN